MDRLYGRTPGTYYPSYPSRTVRKPAKKHYLNGVREPGQWLAVSNDGYMSYRVGELVTTHLKPKLGFVALKRAEVEEAKTLEATEDVSAALLFTALERYPKYTYVHVGRGVTLAALDNFTEKGSSVGSIRERLLEANPWLAEGEKPAATVWYPEVDQAIPVQYE
jgi:hypothetical protein